MNARLKSVGKALLAGVLISASISLIVISGLWNRLAVSSMLVYPVLMCEHTLVKPLKNIFQRRRDSRDLQISLEHIQLERDALYCENIALKTLVAYQHDVDELVDFKARYLTKDARVCQIISKQIDDQQHSVLLDAGSRKGVKVDMVAVYQNAIVGRVIEVYPLYCKVALATDARCKVGAVCMNTKSCGIYCGSNTLEGARLTQVSHLSTVAHNDMVLSSGEGLIFPRGFSLGKVKSHTQRGLFYDIELQPAVDITALAYCLLIDHDGAYLKS